MKKLILIVIFMTVKATFAQESGDFESEVSKDAIQSDVKWQRNLVSFSTEVISTTFNDKRVNAVGFGVGARYGLSQKWAGGLDLKESFDIGDQFATLYLAISMKLTYAFTGSMLSSNKEVIVGNQKVVNSTPLSINGVRLQGIVSEYLFHGGNQVVPAFGGGLAVFYEWTNARLYNYQVGFRGEYATNRDKSVTPIQVFFSIGLWL